MNPELIHTGLALLLFVGGLLGTVWRISWIVSNALSDMKREYNALLDLKEAEFDSKIGRVYQRFDEYKVHMENNFIRKDMCSVMHTANANATEEFRKEMLRRMDSMEVKMDALIMGKK